KVLQDKLLERNTKGRDTLVGTFLSAKTDRAVSISTSTGAAVATLRKHEVRRGQKRYYLEVVESTGECATTPPGGVATAADDSPRGARTSISAEGAGRDSPSALDPPEGGGTPAQAREQGQSGNDLEWC